MHFPLVVVVMSTYNGKAYIKEQIDSILSQDRVDVIIYIRDDGSTDGTPDIISDYEEKHPNVILERGVNLGFAKSFMTALEHAPKAKYYAFSDQDDVWDKDKLFKTIQPMDASSEKPQLAYCNSMDTDEHLKNGVIHYSVSRIPPYKGMSFIASVSSGFLMVINNDIRDKIVLSYHDVPISHDLWAGSLASFLGTVYRVDEPLVLHRRLNNSVSINHPLKTIKHRFYSIIKDRGVCSRCAEIMLKHFSDCLDEDSKNLLEDIKCYRNSIKSKARLINNRNMRYQSRFGKVIICIKILMNRF